MDFSFLFDAYYLGVLLKGLLLTLLLAILSIILGAILSFIPAFMRLSKIKIFRFLGTAYVEFIRGTPLLVQVLLIYSIVKLPVKLVLGIDISSFIPGVIGLVINSSAYMAEILRGGILAVDKGQKEAALSLGLTNGQTFRHIILPQAIKQMIPSLGNEFASLIKETSIFTYLGIAELMYAASIVKVGIYAIKEVYIVTAILYFVLTYSTSLLMSKIEERMRRHDGR